MTLIVTTTGGMLLRFSLVDEKLSEVPTQEESRSSRLIKGKVDETARNAGDGSPEEFLAGTR